MIIAFKSAYLTLDSNGIRAHDAPRVFGAKRQIKVTLVRVNRGHGKTSGIRSRIFHII